jgi:hypothetical protein
MNLIIIDSGIDHRLTHRGTANTIDCDHSVIYIAAMAPQQRLLHYLTRHAHSTKRH